MKKIILVLCLALSSTLAFGFGFPVGSEWVTEYSRGVAQFSLRSVAQDQVELSVDPNHCSINELGERVICTKMATHVIRAKLKYVTVDGQNRMTEVYQLDGTPYSVVVFNVMGEIEGATLIVHDSDGKPTDALRFFRSNTR